jgi:N-carbamoylputrescine amidase
VSLIIVSATAKSRFIANHTGEKQVEANRTDEAVFVHMFGLNAIRADR